MTIQKIVLALGLGLAVAGCSGASGSFGSLGAGSARSGEAPTQAATRVRGGETVAVNRYLWAASFDVLGFLPVESVDPFTGVIVFGYGTPPGGNRAYRATVFISDPALDARALNLSMQTRSGPVAVETQRAVEDAILARARQLRIADGNL